MIIRTQGDSVHMRLVHMWLVHIQRHVYNLELKPFRRKARNGARRHVKPCPVCRLCNRVVQVEEKLIGTTPDGRHLAERQSQPHGLRQLNALSTDGLVLEQSDETTSAGVRPYVVAQKVSQFQACSKGDLALSDP